MIYFYYILSIYIQESIIFKFYVNKLLLIAVTVSNHVTINKSALFSYIHNTKYFQMLFQAQVREYTYT